MELNEEDVKKMSALTPFMKMVLRQLLICINSILDGECNIKEEEQEMTLEAISLLVSSERYLSKYQVAQMLHVTTRQVERYISLGYIPKGKHQLGFKELGWKRKDIEKCRIRLIGK